MAKSYLEFFRGYDEDPVAMLERTFEEVEGYDEIVLLRDIRLESHCDITWCRSSAARTWRICRTSASWEFPSWRAWWMHMRTGLQIQEKLTAQICNTINDVLAPRGTAVIIEAAHECMTTRGVHKTGVSM